MISNHPIDPFDLKEISKLHPRRLFWTAYGRIMNSYGRKTQQPVFDLIQQLEPKYLFTERGDFLTDTAVTSSQIELLKMAIRDTEALTEPIAEIGSYRGVTTQLLATSTRRLVYAIDPYIGYGGWESDLNSFKERCQDLSNVHHLRMPSGTAFKQFQQEQEFSLIFIDAVHDFINTWFDFCSWSSLVKLYGLIAMHDVDDFPGTNLAFRQVINQTDKYRLWAYCPNLAIFQKVSND